MRRASSNTPGSCILPPASSTARLRRALRSLLRIGLPGLMLLTSCGAQAVEAGYAAKAVDLLEQPQAGARALAALAKRQPVQITARAGSWVRIRAGDAAGWMRLADLRLSRTNVPATVKTVVPAGAPNAGIRGFSEEELLVGAPNHAESERLRALAVSARDAASFARAANLRPRQQDYLQMLDFMPEGGFPKEFFDE